MDCTLLFRSILKIMDPESDANPVVQQLWRIFTYYALHADPDQPLSLKVSLSPIYLYSLYKSDIKTKILLYVYSIFLFRFRISSSFVRIHKSYPKNSLVL